uniref:Serpentine receptor class gamma n=1 Tax=Caenorhabditis tropicalis TaxID=1561998 RepID=A0A1I7V224_9PELO
MDSMIIIDTILSNKTDPAYERFLQPFIVFKFASDVLSISTFLLLIVYRVFKKQRQNVEDVHAPMFNQFFFIASISVLINSFNLLFGFLSEELHLGVYVIYIHAVIMTFLIVMHTVLFISIILFSFLAAVQRIIILYFSQYKFLVIDSNLNYLIFFTWLIILHYNYIHHGSYRFSISKPTRF